MHRIEDGGALSADGETVRGVLNVASGEDLASFQQKRCPNAKLGVWCVGVFIRPLRSGKKLFLLECSKNKRLEYKLHVIGDNSGQAKGHR